MIKGHRLLLFLMLPAVVSARDGGMVHDVLSRHIQEFNANSPVYRLTLENLSLPSGEEIGGVVTTNYFNVSDLQNIRQVVAKFLGNRSVQMTVVSEGNKTSNLYVRCQFGLEIKTAVATTSLFKGDVVSDQDVKYEWVKFGTGSASVLLQPSDVIRKLVTRPIKEGVAFSRSFLKANNVVKRGEVAQLTIGRNQLTVTSQVKPLQNGEIGDVVRVMSLATKKVLLAEVVGTRRLRFREGIR